MKGIVFSIEEFSVYDGPGIRTTVFLKGCPLRCTWCHNPEGQSFSPEIARSPNGCLHCGTCETEATAENGTLRFTEKSIQACPVRLLRTVGAECDSDALCEKLLKNRALLQNGGVTFSGGEPLSQSDFVFACLARLKGNLHTAIQTSGFTAPEIFQKALASADYFLYDLKIMDDVLHKRFTGVSNRVILENFKALANSGKEFTIRVPLIPTVTDTHENLSAIARLLSENGVRYVELLPYNTMAGGKYKMLLREYAPRFDETARVMTRVEIFDTYSIQTKIL